MAAEAPRDDSERGAEIYRRCHVLAGLAFFFFFAPPSFLARHNKKSCLPIG